MGTWEGKKKGGRVPYFAFEPEIFSTKFCSPVPNPGLGQIQNQIRDRDSDLILNKTKSNTETQIWF